MMLVAIQKSAVSSHGLVGDDVVMEVGRSLYVHRNRAFEQQEFDGLRIGPAAGPCGIDS